MSRKPRILFVILTWNSEKHVESCIESIVHCKEIDPIIRVVDNGSSDTTSAILRRLSDEYVEVCPMFLDENLGNTVSRNIALQKLTEMDDYVCVLDSDTVVNEQALLRLVKVLNDDHSIGIVGPTMSDSLGVVQQSGRNLPTLGIKLAKAFPCSVVQNKGVQLETPKSPILNHLQDVPYLISACWLVPSRVFEIVGLFDEHIFYAPEDVDWCVRVSKAGYRIVRCWDAQIVHEYQRISTKRFFSKMNFEHLKGLAYFFRKHGYLFSSNKISKQIRKA